MRALGRVGGEQLETPVDREAEAEGIERRLTSRELRNAFVWTEILGLPVALRE